MDGYLGSFRIGPGGAISRRVLFPRRNCWRRRCRVRAIARPRCVTSGRRVADAGVPHQNGLVAAAAKAFEADRIVVIGCTGSGKSTLAAVLAERLDAAHIRQDGLGLEGSDQYVRRAATAVFGDRWVFDGAPYYVEELVYGRAELIVAFDLQRRVVMGRVITRSLRLAPAPHRDRSWRAWLNREHPVRWAWSTWRDRNHELANLGDQAGASQATIVELSTPRGVTAWLERRIDPGWSVQPPANP